MKRRADNKVATRIDMHDDSPLSLLVLRTSLFFRLGVIAEWNGTSEIAPYSADTHG